MKKYIIQCYMCVFLLIFTWLVVPLSLAATQDVPSELAYEVEYVQGEQGAFALVWLDIREEYYTYAYTLHSTVGLPATLYAQAVSQDNAKQALTVLYPKGQDRLDFYDTSKTISAYTGKVPFFIDLQDVVQGVPLEGQAKLLLCSKEHCLPVTLPLQFALPSKPWPNMTKEQHKLLQENTATGLHTQLTFDPSKRSALGLVSSATEISPAASMPILPLRPLHPLREEENIAKQNMPDWQFSPRNFTESLEVSSLGKALLLSLLAGFILNIMPCVLPVLTLKASALLFITDEGSARFKAFRVHSLLFAAGILTQFIILALILGLAGLFWGEIFQNNYFVAAMVVIVFTLALSMFGLFTLPMLDLKAGQSSSPHVQAYVTGIMATMLATPCSGPLLGGVLSFAFVQPLPIIMLIFVTVGVGMALPYIAMAIQPRLAALLPKPGAWMHVLEKIIGFFLLATCLYLLSILPEKMLLPMLLSLLMVAVLGWIWGSFGDLRAPRWRRYMLGSFLLIGIVAAVLYVARPEPAAQIIWQEFSAHTFQENVGKKNMLVEFTADWCPNCKFLEKTVLTEENLRDLQKHYDLTFVRVDLTHDNAAGEALLQALGGSSIPFSAIFGAGLQGQSPIILRDIYTLDALKGALALAFPQ